MRIPRILIHGRWVAIPRWQQAYGADYHFSGQTNKAMPVPPILAPLQAWAQDAIDPRINGLLVNWYDADLKHYIGAHERQHEDDVPAGFNRHGYLRGHADDAAPPLEG